MTELQPPTRHPGLEVVRGAALLALFALQGMGSAPSPALLSAQVAALLLSAVVAGRVFGRTLDQDGLAACTGHLARRAGQYALVFAGLGAVLLLLRAGGAVDPAALAVWQATADTPAQVLLPLPGDSLLYQWREWLLLRAGPVPLQILVLSTWLLLASPLLLWLMQRVPVALPAALALALAAWSELPAWTDAPFEGPHPLGRWLAVWVVGLTLGVGWDGMARWAPAGRRLTLLALVATSMMLWGQAQRPELAALAAACAGALLAHEALRLPLAAVRALRLLAQWPVLAWLVHGAMLLGAAVAPAGAGPVAWCLASLAAVLLAVALAELRQQLVQPGAGRPLAGRGMRDAGHYNEDRALLFRRSQGPGANTLGQ